MEKQFNDKNTIKTIFFNIIKAIILIIYFFAINIACKYIREEEIYEYIKIFAVIYLILGIINLERAYKKDSGKNAIFSIELFIISAHTLSIEYVISKFKFDLQIYLLASSYIFAIYYVLKSIIIYTKSRSKYLASLSDVPEIVKEEKPKIKEAKRKKADNIEEKESKEIVNGIKEDTIKENYSNLEEKNIENKIKPKANKKEKDKEENKEEKSKTKTKETKEENKEESKEEKTEKSKTKPKKAKKEKDKEESKEEKIEKNKIKPKETKKEKDKEESKEEKIEKSKTKPKTTKKAKSKKTNNTEEITLNDNTAIDTKIVEISEKEEIKPKVKASEKRKSKEENETKKNEEIEKNEENKKTNTKHKKEVKK